ncbi:hypothetical protein [Rhodanobacter sp. OK091]|uniref:hypothetical protein n=1 Tax=Rhodanobacter sp. OK091 TaxID=1881037 RepID=UPI0011607382|nr:hypothetical protein [Rhodanobacter sp. OK091]
MEIERQKSHTSWGQPSAFAWFFGCSAAIGLAAAAHWRALDIAFALAWLAFLVVGSFVVLWRAWRHHGEPGTAKLGQLAALPRSWRQWVLGETKDGSAK